MNCYAYTYVVLFLIVRIGAAIETEGHIRSKNFRVLSAIPGDGEQVQGLDIYPDAIEVKRTERRVIKSIPQCHRSGAKEAAALYRIRIEERVRRVGIRFQYRHICS